jgi:hypothetical protein
MASIHFLEARVLKSSQIKKAIIPDTVMSMAILPTPILLRVASPDSSG